MEDMNYVEWSKAKALERKACLACEQEDAFKNATADELEAATPCAFKHEGPFCKVEAQS